MPDIDVLRSVNFGSRVAEEEADRLASYFVETLQWHRMANGEIDVVYGPKGSGKSAIYSLLMTRRDEFFDRSIILIPGESPQGAPAFQDLEKDPPTSESEFLSMWKLYFAALLGERAAEFGLSSPEAVKLLKLLEGAGLRQRDRTLPAMIRAVIGYIQRLRFTATMGSDEQSRPQMAYSISLGEPTSEQRQMGVIPVDEVLQLADKAWAKARYDVWLLMDRLDVAFADNADLEENALRALFRAYLDMIPLEHIRIKIFLRSDIWNRLTAKGFREASHITREMSISWDEPSLLNLIVKRTLGNPVVREQYGISDMNLTYAQQLAFFAQAFPEQIDQGPKKQKTMGWILGRTRDGTGVAAPREIIHLLSAARDVQIKMLERGETEAGEYLLGRAAFKAGLAEVSRVRLEKTLYAEYPRLRKECQLLKGAKTLQTPESLAEIWNCTAARAFKSAEELVAVGFFEPRGSNAEPQYWVPFLYRDALSLVQGSAVASGGPDWDVLMEDDNEPF